MCPEASSAASSPVNQTVTATPAISTKTVISAMSEPLSAITDLRQSLRVPIGVLVAITIWFGFFPQTFVKLVTPTFKTYFAKQ